MLNMYCNTLCSVVSRQIIPNAEKWWTNPNTGEVTLGEIEGRELVQACVRNTVETACIAYSDAVRYSSG